MPEGKKKNSKKNPCRFSLSHWHLGHNSPQKEVAANAEPKKLAKKHRKKTILELTDDKEGTVTIIGTLSDMKVNWDTEPTLTWILITTIQEDDAIKQGLFPMPGQDMLTGGGKVKGKHHAAIAAVLFADHAVYGQAFAAATIAKAKGSWILKVKNHIKFLTADFHKYQDEMGATGAGMEHEEDIDMSQANAFMTKWAQIKAEFSWFWEIKSLTGCSSSPSIEAISQEPEKEDLDYDDGDCEQEEEGELMSDDESAVVKAKKETKLPKPTIATKKTAACAATSAPAVKPSVSKTEKAKGKFVKMGIKEEEMMQKKLEFKRAVADGNTCVGIAKVQSQAEVKMNSDKLRANIRMQKMCFDLKKDKLEHEKEMQKFKLEAMKMEFQFRSSQPSQTLLAAASWSNENSIWNSGASSSSGNQTNEDTFYNGTYL
ncbi:hypothetical protein C8J56DRAFT_899839 [Mycena floridula]|nr:hypothetical protein C8J56DRAFT_899837 [Mycena floridula]KAJ7576748.1 hypothetical protein C8J56DRAFT_899839 [Mycena floridula]